MQINLKLTNIDHSPELEKFAKEKISELDKYLPDPSGVVEAWIEIGRTTFHHQSGDIFRAECDIRLPGKVLRAVAERHDVNTAILEIKDQLQKEIKNYKEQIITKRRRGERMIKMIKNYSPLAWGKKMFRKK
ncbi:MAG: ribosome-associated translation inhibitor RaiA [Candidatus Buchananbacteria bacterium]